MARYVHVGIGASGDATHVIVLSDYANSKALRKGMNTLLRKYSATLYPWIEVVTRKFATFAVHRYRSWFRDYHVFECTEAQDFCGLYRLLIFINDWIAEYGRYSEAKGIQEELNEIIRKSEWISDMIDNLWNLAKKLWELEIIINQRIAAARQRMFKRFETHHKENTAILEKYFPELTAPVIRAFGTHFAIREYLENKNIQHAPEYAWLVHQNKAIMILNNGKFELLTELPPEKIGGLSVYADSCEDTDKFATCKLVTIHNNAVLWVAVVGVDKLTNQRFIHYVPSTFLLRDVETCRRWVLGLVNDHGKPIYDNVELIET